jgi:hypothetical protein
MKDATQKLDGMQIESILDLPARNARMGKRDKIDGCRNAGLVPGAKR